MNFNDEYSNTVDNDDVRKIMNAGDNLFLKNGSANLIVERRPTLKVTDTIRLNLTNTRINPYKFEIDPSALSNIGLQPILKDKFLATETPVSISNTTTYDFNITADAASRAADRFMIVFKQVPPMRFTKIKADRNKDNSATVNWYTENENNINTYAIEYSKDGINFSEIGKQTPTANNNGNPYYSFVHTAPADGNNWYRIKANAINGEVQYSDVAKIADKEIVSPAKISVYPNPVTDGKIYVNFVNETFGNYELIITNMAGQTVYSEVLQLENNNLQKTIGLRNVAAGNYQLTVKDETGITKKISFIVK